MKGFAIVFLALFAAAQARSFAVETRSTEVATAGSNPWLVHLRLAVSTSGFLNSCTGSLIHESWVLTTARCVENVRFIWIRYGAVEVISPELVTESSAVRLHPTDDVALISINRVVHSTANISPVSLSSDADVPSTANFCAYGDDSGKPGEVLKCQDLTLEDGDNIVAHGEPTTQFDIGAPLVSNGVQIGILSGVGNGDSAATFLKASNYISWIQDTAQITL